ncbi:Nucleophosmin, partial [Galemys pyrenaicus]
MTGVGSPDKSTLTTLKMSAQPTGTGSVEDFKAKLQPTIEKGGSLPKVEIKFINYVKNCFQMTGQEVIQDLWQGRKEVSLKERFQQ